MWRATWLVMALWTFSPVPASACSCMTQSIEDARASATAIFEGRVVSITPEPGTLVVTFAVTQAWGGVEHEQLVLRTAESSVSCGYEFAVGRTYLVYAGGEHGALTASLCSRTAPIENAAEDRAALGAGTIPVDITDEPVEPVREARTEPPARGGCASCGAGASRAHGGLAVAVVLALGLARRRRA